MPASKRRAPRAVAVDARVRGSFRAQPTTSRPERRGGTLPKGGLGRFVAKAWGSAEGADPKVDRGAARNEREERHGSPRGKGAPASGVRGSLSHGTGNGRRSGSRRLSRRPQSGR